ASLHRQKPTQAAAWATQCARQVRWRFVIFGAAAVWQLVAALGFLDLETPRFSKNPKAISSHRTPESYAALRRR
ncbi:MAG: hypothetical protein L0Y72_28530, partial [Gemmataceae bacterium]|nr:hypothetical protein [Gemmataceae bacterium]MCI0742995.1 hypothetical protein [Gemmataceae bacterium]